MARNGVGVYNLPTGQPVVTGTTISSSVFNVLTSDLANALTTSLATDGQTAMAANLPMGGNKSTGLAAGTVAGDSVRFEQLTADSVTNTPAGGITEATVQAALNGLETRKATAGAPGNLIKNGNKLVFTHGLSASIVAGLGVPTASLGYYTTGMFYAYSTGANVTLASVAGADATHRYDQFTGAAAVTGIGHGYRAEAADSAHMANRTCTYTVELANSLLAVVSWAASYANTVDAFGTIAVPTKTLIATGTFTVTGTITRYSVQISAPVAATSGIEIVLTVGAQTSGTWTIGREDFRVGSVSPILFEAPKIDETIRAVQRYYERISGAVAGAAINVAQYALAANAFNLTVYWKATKRANPTLSKVGTWTVTNTSQPTVGGPGLDSCFIQGIATATGQASYATADATTYIDASAYVP